MSCLLLLQCKKHLLRFIMLYMYCTVLYAFLVDCCCIAPSNKVTKAQLVESDNCDRWNVEFVPHEIGELFCQESINLSINHECLSNRATSRLDC